MGNENIAKGKRLLSLDVLRRDSRTPSATGRGLFRRGSLRPRFFSPY